MYNFQRLDANKYTGHDILNEILEYCQFLAEFQCFLICP